MSASTTSPPPSSVSDPPVGLACAQVRGGNARAHVPIALPGIRGVLHSEPSDGGNGGDVHYLSVCGSGLLSRMCLADVVGHGETVARIGERLHRLLRRSVNRPDHRHILGALNDALMNIGFDAITTAAICTYYPPSRTLSFSYAGHPPGWFFGGRERTWRRLCAEPSETGPGGFVDGILGASARATYTRSRLKVAPGDRLLLITDGVVETPDSTRALFGDGRLEEVLTAHREEAPAALAERILDALARHGGDRTLGHDDVTLLLVEFTAGPAGPALWHVVRNRMLKPLRLVRDAVPTDMGT